MKYPIQSAIDDFDSMVRLVAPRVAQKPQYLAVKSGWQEYLMFLEPLVSGRHHFSAEAKDKFWPEAQRTLTSIKDEQVAEKALYFGVMSMSTLVVAKRRNEYRMIDFDELSQLWFSQSLYPIESLRGYGFFDVVNLNGVDALLQGFLRLHVQPLVQSPDKMSDALSHFETQFFSGILLGQIVLYLILRPHYSKHRPSKMQLIRKLLKARLSSDPTATLAGVTPDLVDEQSDQDVLGTPEATAVTIVESYIQMRRLGLLESQILARIENHRSMIGAGAMPSALTLRAYIRYRVSLEYANRAPVSDASLDYSIREALDHFETEE